MTESFRSRAAPQIVAVAVLLGMAALWHGFSQRDWPDVLMAMSANRSMGYLYFLSGCVLTIVLVAKVFRLRHAAVAVSMGVLIAMFANGAWPVLAIGGYFIACWSLGCLVLQRLCRGDSALDEVTRVLTGTGLFGTLAGLAAHAEVNYAWVYVLMLAAPVPAVRGRLVGILKRGFYTLFERSENRSGALLNGLVGALLLVYFAFAFLPEIAHDPLAMHLYVPTYLEANHRWNFDPELYVWTLMPMLADWNFTIGYVLAGEAGARLVNFGFLFLGACLVRDLVFRVGGGRKGAGWAVLLLLSTPLTFLLGVALYVEAFWSACLVAGLSWLLRWSKVAGTDARLASRSSLPVAGLLLGFSVAAKSVALVYLPFCAFPVVLRMRALFSRDMGLSLVKAGLLFLAVGCVPYAVSYLVSGNPVFPFFNEVFASSYYPAENFDNARFRSKIDWTLPYSIVFSSERYIQGRMGGSGFQWVTLGLALPAVLLLRLNWRALLLFVVAVLSLLAVFQFQSQLRYVYPVFLITAALIGWALSDLKRANGAVAGSLSVVVGFTAAVNLAFFGAAAERYFGVPVLETFNPHGFAKLKAQLAPGRQASDLVNLVNSARGPVAILAAPYGAGLESDAIYANWYNGRFKKRIDAATDSKAFVDVLRDYGVRFLIYDSSWKRNPPRMRSIVAESTNLIRAFGSIGVHEVKADLYYQRELLESPGLFDGNRWSVREGARLLSDGAIAVSRNAPVMQAVAVEAGKTYLNTVIARCGSERGDGRTQVNWTDREGRFLRADIVAFRCRDELAMESQEVKAPHRAGFAVVYGTSHGDAEIEIAEISFRSTGAGTPASSRD